jgi:hypothetical protein
MPKFVVVVSVSAEQTVEKRYFGISVVTTDHQHDGMGQNQNVKKSRQPERPVSDGHHDTT